jgi:hypothetical protein
VDDLGRSAQRIVEAFAAADPLPGAASAVALTAARLATVRAQLPPVLV